MRVADFATAAAKVRDATKTLRLRWEETKQSWQDAVARDFEEKYLVPLEPEILITMERLSRLSQVVTAAGQECSPDRG